MAALDTLDAAERRLLRPAAAPAHAAAMKAVLTRERFSDPEWLFERKLDGIRCIAVRSGAQTRLLSRNDLSLNKRYPEIAAAIGAQPCERLALDGEIVAFDGARTSFARLAGRGAHRVPVFYYVFDVLWLDGYDARLLPLRSRKRLLRSAVAFQDPLRLTPYRRGEGEALYERACRSGWEGVIAKRIASPYTATRSADWLKFKCELGQELVVGGYTAPRGSRVEFGALLLGHYRDGQLCYAGKVGTGFDELTLRALGRRLRALRVSEPPFADASQIRPRGAIWVEPSLVAQVAFTEWTDDGRLRHPRFLGLRDDKPASEVVREQ